MELDDLEGVLTAENDVVVEFIPQLCISIAVGTGLEVSASDVTIKSRLLVEGQGCVLSARSTGAKLLHRVCTLLYLELRVVGTPC